MDAALFASLVREEEERERAEIIGERADELLYDREWLDQLDVMALDKDNWQELLIKFSQLPVLFMDNLHQLAPDWRTTSKQPGVDKLMEVAECLYTLMKEHAEYFAEKEYEERCRAYPDDYGYDGEDY